MDYLTPPLPKITSTSARLPASSNGKLSSYDQDIIGSIGLSQKEFVTIEDAFHHSFNFGWSCLLAISQLTESEKEEYIATYNVSFWELNSYDTVSFNQRVRVSMASGFAYILTALPKLYPHIQHYMEMEGNLDRELLYMLQNPRTVWQPVEFSHFAQSKLDTRKEELLILKDRYFKAEGDTHLSDTMQRLELISALSGMCGVMSMGKRASSEAFSYSFEAYWEFPTYLLALLHQREECHTEETWYAQRKQEMQNPDFLAFCSVWQKYVDRVILNTFDDDKRHIPRLL